MYNKYKTISLIIAIKRKNKNSVLLKKPKHIVARNFGISPQTLSRLLKSGINEGWIIEKSDRWEIIKLRKIFIDFKIKTGLNFMFHSILNSKETNFYKILSLFESLMVNDNIIMPQHLRYEEKTQKIRERLLRTGMRDEAYRNPLPGCRRSISTSARQAGRKLGISSAKANKILNGGHDLFKRKIRINIFKRPSKLYVNEIRERFPEKFSYWSEKHKGVILCHGSSLKYDKNKFDRRYIKMVYYL